MTAFINTPLDPRVKDLWLMDHPGGVVSLSLLYLLFVLKIGPAIMKSRKPFSIQLYVRLFNLLQVLANVYFVSLGIYLAFFKLGFRLICEPLHRRVDTDNMKLVHLYYFYWLVRLSDYLDTVFFVLRKKHASHVTFLHVYHHLCVSLNGWFYIRHGWIHGAITGVLVNSMIHIVMYFYFFLATFPQMRRHLWWKKYITSVQIVQFVVFCILVLVTLFDPDNCGYPKIALYNCFANVILFLVLFTQFYISTYVSSSKDVKKAS